MDEVGAASLSIQLLVVPGCPSRAHTQARLRSVLDELGLTDTPIEMIVIVIVSDDDAVATGFTGSPSLRTNGMDALPQSGPVGLTCRLYHTATGLSGLPAATNMRSAILAAASQ